ncbi:TetR/AcrR family transcriptional regulator [Tenacibaculum mesophilum]|uniref:TetR/AcrR family transcriptional regulator n=1 Tax=Tenacibaculum mesophilum TaxID=104268 RepID=A0AAE9MN29_9FLAO|nr:TetR/AcrR family transcriptional regulator [Tenacibaculum mesophilum]UTD15069.1 TetR/AcrR family transcriptional regulator [Tenacibaculum mesophilum]
MSNPRERILETVAHLFHQQGYNSTGINQVIKEAKVAKASFYQHFKSKDALCVDFLNNRHEFWFKELFKFTSKSKNSKDTILLSFDFVAHMNTKEDFRGCSFLNILSEISKEQETILIVIQSHKKELNNFFQELTDNELLATHIYLLFESAIIESQLFKSNEIVYKSKKIIQNLL